MKLKDIRLGEIEQYAQVVAKSEIEKFKREGWYEWSEFEDFNADDLNAFFVYGEINPKKETLLLKPLQSLKNYAINTLINCKITRFSCHLGTYGMGGPGFFGLLLDDKQYMVYTVWNAGNYTLVNDIIIESSPSLYIKQKPLISNFDTDEWDNLSDLIIDYEIAHIDFTNDKFSIVIMKNGHKNQIDFVKNDIRIPRKVGKIKNAYKKGEISDYLVFQEKNARLII